MIRKTLLKPTKFRSVFKEVHHKQSNCNARCLRVEIRLLSSSDPRISVSSAKNRKYELHSAEHFPCQGPQNSAKRQKNLDIIHLYKYIVSCYTLQDQLYFERTCVKSQNLLDKAKEKMFPNAQCQSSQPKNIVKRNAIILLHVASNVSIMRVLSSYLIKEIENVF